MDENHCSYIRSRFKFWATFYDFIDIFISGVRDKVVNIAGAEKGSKILDICTGTGKQSLAFGKRGYDVTGIDISEDMLKVAIKKNKYDNVRFKVADATEIPFEDSSFDISCISFALHEMPLNIRKKVLREALRVTKHKGKLIIVDYSLPKNRISSFLAYHFIKSYESKYFPGFINSDLETLIMGHKLKLKEVHPIILGCGKILVYEKR